MPVMIAGGHMDFWNAERLIAHIVGPSATTMAVTFLAQAVPDIGGINWGTIGPTGAVCLFCGWLLTRTIPEMQKHHAETLSKQEESHARQLEVIRDEWQETRHDVRSHVDRMATAMEAFLKAQGSR